MSIGRWPADEPLPAILSDRDLMRVLGWSEAKFYRYKRVRKFDGFLCVPQLTRYSQYSGELVSRWVRGENKLDAFKPQARRHVQQSAPVNG